jgi:tetratricopeptide (TPR) repeat protein
VHDEDGWPQHRLWWNQQQPLHADLGIHLGELTSNEGGAPSCYDLDVPRPPRPYLIGAVAVTALLGGIGFLPLFGGPGYEQSLATGLVVPTTAAIATAIDVGRRGTKTPLASVGRGVLCGLGYVMLALVTALLHAARIGICELWGALLYFALTAGVGSVLGGVWGAVVGELTGVLVARRGLRRLRLVATLLTLAGPFGGVAASLYRFYSSPMIFAFDPFVGYFSGTLYDTVIDAGTSLLTYRLGTLATLTAIALFASILVRDDDRPFGLVLDLRSGSTRARAALGLAAMAASLGITLAGSKLGHFSTTESIVKDLGAEKHGARCDVVYPSTTREQEANLLVKDCEEQVREVEQRLGTKGPSRVRAFFFRDDNDKKRLMGAAHTYIAKPWREEVYLQLGSYPHPVLGHELAHVIAGSFGRGAFRIAGDVGGYLPNPGLIEGIAVAASPDDEDLTDEQWARAMMKIGILPKMQRVFSLGFLGDASAKSYTLAGAFVSWIADKWGMEAVRGWYGGGDITAITGKPWSELESAFRAHLDTVPLPAEAESFARAKFARPGLFGRRCPHVVDAMRHEADVCRDTQRFEEAIRIYSEALSKDPVDFASRHSRAQTIRRHGDRAKGRADLEAIASSQEVPRTWRDRADEALADADLIEGNLEPARTRYSELAARSLDEDAARTLEVKRLATEDPAAREAITALLLGDEKHGPDIFVAGNALGVWPSKTPAGRSPLASYLVGRNLVQRGFFEKGAATLDEALLGPMPTPRIARETVRQRAVAACALDDRAALARMKGVIDGPDDPFKGASGGRRAATLRMIARCSR